MRKLVLTTALALAAMAMTATSAMAAIEVRDPDTGQLCPAVSPAINATNAAPLSMTRNYVSGGCTIQMSSVGTHTLYAFSNGSNAMTCQSTFDVHVGPDGWGYAENVSYSNCSGTGAAQCTGDRMVAPPDYTRPPGYGFDYFSFADASSDLNVEMCARISTSTNWGFVSMDVTYPGGGAWNWANQYDGSDPTWTGFVPQRHRNGIWTSNSDSLTITHL